MESVNIYPKKIKLYFFTLGTLAFVILSVWIIFTHQHNDRYKLAAIAGVVFFGFGLVIFVRKLFDKKPLYILSDEGIYYYQFPKSKMLYWKYVDSIKETVVPMISDRFICLNIKDGCEKESGVVQNYFDGGYRVEIPAGMVKGYTFDELKKLIEEYFERKING